MLQLPLQVHTRDRRPTMSLLEERSSCAPWCHTGLSGSSWGTGVSFMPYREHAGKCAPLRPPQPHPSSPALLCMPGCSPGSKSVLPTLESGQCGLRVAPRPPRPTLPQVCPLQIQKERWSRQTTGGFQVSDHLQIQPPSFQRCLCKCHPP